MTGLRSVGWARVCLALMVNLFAGAAVAESTTRFSFAVVGDLPYFAWEEVRFEKLIDDWNAQDLQFVVHIGDIKNGHDPCTDALFYQRKALFDRSTHPFIYLPGDNEWTDCHRPTAGSYDPLERLEKLREVFYPTDESLGQHRLALMRQSDDAAYAPYRENVRWVMEGVVFAGVNVTGSNNGFGISLAGDAEYRVRSDANLVWMRDAFALAKKQNYREVVIAMQADPHFEAASGSRARRGFEDFLRALEQEVVSFRGPVLLIHGDTHRYRVDHPLRNSRSGLPLANFTRLETFGSPHVGWVKVTVDRDQPEVFAIEPVR